MIFLEWLAGNWKLIGICLGMLINLAGVFYNICRTCFSGKTKEAAHWLAILQAARKYEREAESFPDYSAAEKLQYVLSRLRTFTAEQGIAFDEAKLAAQIEEDIAFTKAVNPPVGERLE